MIFKNIAAAALLSLTPMLATAEDISTHVLDISSGTGAAGIPVVLERAEGDTWQKLGESSTADNGRVEGFDIEAQTGTYRLRFDMSDYEGFADRPETFFPEIVIEFQINDAERHHHVPVVVSGFGYSTYLGN